VTAGTLVLSGSATSLTSWVTLDTLRASLVSLVKVESFFAFSKIVWNGSGSAGLVVLDFESVVGQTS
jgi:hypothetical protein